MLKKISVMFLAVLVGSITVFAQDMQTRNLTAGQKYKIKGVVVSSDSNSSFVVRDAVGVDTQVRVTPGASIKTNSFWGSGDSYPATAIIRGLNIEVEGRGDTAGMLSATKVRFDKSDLEVARSIDSRVGPAEDRITQTEQNAERLSGQIDELMAVSNAARGGAKAAQETADAAVAGVNATNQRISSLDDYVVQSTASVNFRTGSSTLSEDAKYQLDEVARTALTLRGYTLEVTGFADATGSPKANKALSQRRAQAVIDYLVTTHNIPLRRIGTSYGFGETQAIGGSSSEDRRVDVKILVSRGLNQNVEVRRTNDDDNR